MTTTTSQTVLRARTAEERVRHSGTARRNDGDRIVDLFGFRGLADLSGPLERHRARKDARGRPSRYPPLALLAALASARITGSLASALTALDDPILWQRCRMAFEDRTGIWLPESPPTRDHVFEIRKDLAKQDATLVDMMTTFTRSAVRQAQKLGNLQPGLEPDWAEPDVRNAIFGDGTIIARYSDVTVTRDPETNEVIDARGSRATAAKRARYQSAFRRSGSDDKKSDGINHVTMHTRTAHGLVVLAVGTELGAEQWTALDLIDRVVAEAGDGVHTLVYDRAVTGWAVEYAMARHGVQAISKISARSARRVKNEGDDPDWDLDSYDYTTEELRSYVQDVVRERGLPRTARVAESLRAEFLGQMFRGERPMQVGSSLYPSSNKDGYEHVQSTYVFVPAHHTRADGSRCVHSLVMDDGALFSVSIDPVIEILVKEEYLPAITSVRHQQPNGAWGTTTSYLVPCSDEDFVWEILWNPSTKRFHRDSTETDRSPADPLGWRLRAVPRCDYERFGRINAGRNDSESFNRWYKDTLTNKRGATIDGRRQLLDLILGAVVKNSDTWSAYNGR
ncbi:hypothetical protein [Cellulomonas sp. GbtcB1]|uniref:hypothetical protein n=1 Tax=Cellulomonas sp. GbtcB1 TaxID=2824746 RepID=UPI001C2FCA6E|nr:hypothetical protein [Cellulomonas sp. GbtcB1]